MVWYSEGEALATVEERGTPASGAPVLSVCIPTYNRAPRLQNALEQFARALSRSKFPREVELVISNNASTDRTADVIRSSLDAVAASSAVRVYSQRANLGAEGNFKFLYEHARGEYVWLWGDDDTLHEEQLDLLVRDLQEHRPEVCISSFANFGNAGDRTRLPAGAEVHLVTDLREGVEHVYPLGKISQYVLRRHDLSPEEQALSDRSARQTSFWFVALAVMLLVRRQPRLLLRAAEIGSSGRDSRDIRFSPRVYGTKKTAVLMALQGSGLQAHFERAIPDAPVDNFVVGNLFRTAVGLNKMERDVALEEFRYLCGRLRPIALSGWRNAVKLPFILTLFPIAARIRYRGEAKEG